MLPISGGISFKGGDKLRAITTENFVTPPYVYLHIPDEYKLTIDIKDTVNKGQIIAIGKDDDLIDIISSISGTAEKFHNNILYIKNDFKETLSPEYSAVSVPLNEMKSNNMDSALKRFGIFDIDTPLFQKVKKAYGKIENLVINCTDSDPSCAIGYRLISEKFEELIGGIKILVHATKARIGIIAIDEKIDNDFPLLSKKIPDNKLILLRTIENKYPSGNEKVLLNALTRKEFQNDNLLSNGRSLILSPESVINTFTALAYGIPETRKFISVSGAINTPKNLYIPKGTKVSDIIEFCGGTTKDDIVAVKNSFMKGQKISMDSVISSDDSIIVISQEHNSQKQCIRCGKCFTVCPMLLKPLHIYLNILCSNEQKNASLGAEHCIGCGCCSFICPSNIPLADVIFKSTPMNKEKNTSSDTIVHSEELQDNVSSSEKDPFFENIQE